MNWYDINNSLLDISQWIIIVVLVFRISSIKNRIDEADLSMIPCPNPKCEPLHPGIAKGIAAADIGEAFKNRRKS